MKSDLAAQRDNISSPGEATLSGAQQRTWVLEQFHPRSPVHNVVCGLRLSGTLDPQELGRAWREVVHLHEILRTQFHAVDGIPRTVMQASSPQLSISDVEDVLHQEREARLSQLAREEARRPFDLSRGPLLRATLWRVTPLEHVLQLVAHHIVCDEASLGIILRQLAERYGIADRGETQPVMESPPYSEYVSRQGTVSEEHLSYWKRQLAGVPAGLDLPIDGARPAEQTFSTAAQYFSIERLGVEKLRLLAKNHGTTLFVTLLAAFNVLLSRYSRQDDVVVGTSIWGREDPGLSNVVGPIENMVALRTGLSGDMSFSELLNRVRDISGEAFSHPDVPFEVLLEHLPLQRDLSRNPLFQVAFQFRAAHVYGQWAGGVVAAPFEIDSGTERFELSLHLTEHADTIEGKLGYNSDLFDAATAGRMKENFLSLIGAASGDPRIAVSQMPLLSDTERHQLLVEWNDTRVEYPTEVPLHKFIEEQVERTPDACAVIYESERLTYRELNSRANQLAHRLKKLGVGADVLVAVCMERSLDLVTALLAILKASAAYVPLDPEYPRDRLESMLQDAAPPVVLAQSHLLDWLPPNAPPVFCLDRDWSLLASESMENLPVSVQGKNLAYAIYTSGSTGKPKGVPNVHEGIVNRLLWMQDMYQLTAEDRVLQKTPFSFDVSVWEFFWPLLAGATLVVARPGGHRDPAYLVNLIAKQKITTLHFVPSMLAIFLEASGLEGCGALRQVFASGEALTLELQQRFFERLGAELHNLYGPTEAAVDVTYWACRPDFPKQIVPIGRPIANTEIYILDSHLEPVPIGVAGELHIGGIGLARGYLNRPDLTQQKFISNPFRTTPGARLYARLYKTGDLARFLPDGNIEYLGRIDNQVKLRGFRIELGEIEAVLGECDGVRQTAVVLREDKPGDKRIVAYLIPAAGAELNVDRLKSEIKRKLPEYMIPARFVILSEFPMTTSGKVDRKALPAPPLERGTSATATAPRNELESKLASIFAHVLRLPSVGVTDDFFDLGGHSLMAARVLTELERITGKQLPLSALFRGATVESLARLIAEREHAGDPLALEIQRGNGGYVPFFAIVPPGEEALGYAMLARHMGSEHAVYKIQGHAPVTGGQRPYTKDEMASLTEEYVAAIRKVQPRGPYCLGGLCDGTHIAEQIVLALEAQGQEVGLFAIFDTWVLQNTQRRWLWNVHYYGQRLRQMKRLNLSERVASYRRIAKKRVDNLLLEKPAPTDWEQTYWPADFTPPRFRAPVLLFKKPKQPFYYIKDSQMGWGARSERGVEIHEVDFHHFEILREPHVREFGKKLAESVAQISRHSIKPQASGTDQQTSQLTISLRQDS